MGLLVNQLVSSSPHFDFSSALEHCSSETYSQKIIFGDQTVWLPADLEGCSRAKDFDAKGVNIEKTGTLGSVDDRGPE